MNKKGLIISREWTKKEDIRLLKLCKLRVSMREVADMMKRTECSVEGRKNYLMIECACSHLPRKHPRGEECVSCTCEQYRPYAKRYASEMECECGHVLDVHPGANACGVCKCKMFLPRIRRFT